MTDLVPPDLRLRASWAEAVAEFGDGEDTCTAPVSGTSTTVDVSPEGAPAIVAHLLAQADPATELPEDRVHCTYFWITDGDPRSSSATSRCGTR